MTDERYHLCERLEHVFTEIHHTRMVDVPLLNPELQVQALGFEPWQDYRIGILMTPWMMNMLLIPEEQSNSALRNGEKQQIALPSGEYEFVRAEEPDIGPYLSCSLFSPVFEFADQRTFEQTAEAALDAIMQAEHREALGFEEWPSEPDPPAEDSLAHNPDTTASDLTEQSNEPEAIDRRAFFRRVGSGAQASNGP